MTTTIQLVNRLRRRFREEDVSALGDDLSNFCIDLLNEAMHDLLESWTWEFDRRSDGELRTKQALQNISCRVVNLDSELYLNTGMTPNQELQAFSGSERAICRAIVTSDGEYGDTAFHMRAYNTTNRSLFFNFDATGGFGDLYWPGVTDNAAVADFVFDEYVLPSTVRAVTSVRHQEQDLQVIEVDRDIGMDGYAPRPHGQMSDSPDRVFVGKRGESTFVYAYKNDLTNAAARYRTGLTMKLDPTPSSPLLISYSYIYQHPELSATQGLDNVDRFAEDLIVRLAEARGTMSGLGADIATGGAMETEVLNRAAALHGNRRPAPLRRVVIQPTLGGVSSPGFGNLPRHFGSL